MKRYDQYKDSGVKWLGEIPSHWKVHTLRAYIRIISVKNQSNKQLLSVTRELGVIVRNIQSKEENHNYIPDDLSSYKLVKKGQFAINKMKSWQGSYGVSEYEGIVSPAYYVCELNFPCKVFFSKAIRSKAYIPFFTQYSKGIRVGQWDLSSTALKNIPFFEPPLSEQHSIVTYLDTKVNKIDIYITIAEKKIAALDELKQVTIADAVTHGIHPNVPMKDSGIKWIGRVPEHWESHSLRAYIRMVSEKNHSYKQLLSVTRQQGVIIRDTESKEENHNYIPDDLSGYKLVRKGQFAINKMKSWQGSYGVSNYEGIVSPAYYVCELEFPYKDFFNEAIRSKAYIPFFTQYSKGIRVDQWDLSPVALKSIPFFAPPLSEQEEIVSYIDRKVAQINKMRNAELAQIEKLKEYKQRLISDVVTGKVKV